MEKEEDEEGSSSNEGLSSPGPVLVKLSNWAQEEEEVEVDED